MFTPNSPESQVIFNLFVLTLAVAAVIFTIVAGGLVYMMIRFRARPGEEEPYQEHGIRRLEIVWTATPALLLAILFGFTVSAMTRIQAGDPPGGEQPDMLVVGHQWWWEYRYPKTGVVTANEAHIPAGQKWLVQVTSADVIHDWWVPQLGRKIDAIPGKPNNYIYVQPDKPGLYLGTCAEYCGASHAWMRIRVYVDSQPDYETWVQQELRVPATPTSGVAAQGAKLFQDKSCATCHTITGTPAHGTAGPDLTHVADRETLGTGIIDEGPGGLSAWIADPQAVKPGIKMPNLKLTPQEVGAIVAYLEALK